MLILWHPRLTHLTQLLPFVELSIEEYVECAMDAVRVEFNVRKFARHFSRLPGLDFRQVFFASFLLFLEEGN